jgi:hypothetical protein
MSKLRTLSLGAAAFAMLATPVAPAFAGGGFGWNSWGGGHGNGWRRHRRGDDDTAEVLGGVLIGALLVGAIASSSKKRKQEEQRRAERDPDLARGEDWTVNRSNSRGDIRSEDQAVDACAMAAESQAGRTSSVRDVDQVRRNGDGWDVEGIIESRDGWRDRSGDRRRFTCSVKFGAVDSVYVEDEKVALAD